jgi:carbamoyltransferase
MYILGISAFYHDSACCLLKDGEIVAAAQEERFSRIKHDSSFPVKSIQFCLKEANISLLNVHHVVFYEKPFLKFERLLETYLSFAPKGLFSFLKAMPVWIKEKLFQKSLIKKNLKKLYPELKEIQILFTEHHLSHAASAFFPSPFDEAIILTADGMGEWASTSVSLGIGNSVTIQKEIKFPHSLGLLYSAFTYFLGFRVNSGEYKVMGLAPYGKPVYVENILNSLIDLKEDGSFKLNMKYFSYATGLKMTNKRFEKLFGCPPRNPESEILDIHMDLAASIQEVVELILVRIVKDIKEEYKINNLCLAGGVALNCVANSRILKEAGLDDIWIQPASGDAGGAIGAAYLGWHHFLDNRKPIVSGDLMKGCFLGPSFKHDEIKNILLSRKCSFLEIEEDELIKKIAVELEQGKVVGWFQGKMEFGPRALGSRSILGDPRNPEMQIKMNLKIKFRESFRPFAPSVINEFLEDFFEFERPSPYMLFTATVKDKFLLYEDGINSKKGLEKLNEKRSMLPAITHVNNTARIQSVHIETNPKFYKLLKEFYNLTGYPLLVNSSFNVRGEPIVCTPEDAIKCFFNTDMDVLVLEGFFLEKMESQRKPLDHKAYLYSD